MTMLVIFVVFCVFLPGTVTGAGNLTLLEKCGELPQPEDIYNYEIKITFDDEVIELYPCLSVLEALMPEDGIDLIEVSVDLVKASKSEAKYIIELGEETPEIMEPDVIPIALRRYEQNWLRLAVNYKQNYAFMVPPKDVAFLWHTHRLSPTNYMKDLKRLFGVSYIWHEFQDSPGLRSIMEAYTAGIWNKHYPDDAYNYKQAQCTCKDKEFKSNLHYDLVDATRRRKSGTNKLVEIAKKFLTDDDYLQRSITAYLMWIKLVKTGKRKRLGPIQAIDIAWHAHQDYPQAYQEDMFTYLGHIAGHDDRDDADKGEEAMKERDEMMAETAHGTHSLWEETFGDLDMIFSLIYF